MPISLTPYRPTPFTLDGSAPPECSLTRPGTAMSWADACQRLSDAFLALGHPLPDPMCEGVGEATYQVPSRYLRVRVGLGAVEDEGAEAVARRILTAVFGSEGDWKTPSDAAFVAQTTVGLGVFGNDYWWVQGITDGPASATSVAWTTDCPTLTFQGPMPFPGAAADWSHAVECPVDRGSDDGEDPHGD